MSSKSPILYLIKDFIDQKIVFYWADADDKPQSPYFNNMTQVEEWWLKFNFSLYKGEERRGSFVDRRRLHSQRNAEHRSRQIPSQTPDGRRYTDIEIKVDKDVSRVKLLQFYSMNPELLEVDSD